MAAGAAFDADAVDILIADMIVKVKEPIAAIGRGFQGAAPVHLSSSRAGSRADRGADQEELAGVAYETITAGGDAAAAHADVGGRGTDGPACRRALLDKDIGGRGVLLGGVPGSPPADVVSSAAASPARTPRSSPSASARRDDPRPITEPLLRFPTSSTRACRPSSRPATPSKRSPPRGPVIGAVLIPGAAAPKLVSARPQGDEERLGHCRRRHRPGRLRRDPRPTTHPNPTYVVDGVVHYCVTNMPGAVAAPRRSRSTTARCRSCSSWPTMASAARSARTQTCATNSTCTKAWSPAAPWPTPSASNTRRPNKRYGCDALRPLQSHNFGTYPA